MELNIVHGKHGSESDAPGKESCVQKPAAAKISCFNDGIVK